MAAHQRLRSAGGCTRMCSTRQAGGLVAHKEDYMATCIASLRGAATASHELTTICRRRPATTTVTIGHVSVRVVRVRPDACGPLTRTAAVRTHQTNGRDLSTEDAQARATGHGRRAARRTEQT